MPRNRAKEPAQLFHGLLECPLRRDFFEFEYQKGDRIKELRARMLETWGMPDIQGVPQSELRIFPFSNLRAWAIACRGINGTALILRDTDEIPTQPLTFPSPVSGKTSPRFYDYETSHAPIQNGEFAQGLLYVPELMRLELKPFLATSENLDVVAGGITELPDQAGGGLPTDQTFNVRLVALALVTGG